MTFPEIFRATRSDFKPLKLVLSFFTVQLLSLAIYSVFSQSPGFESGLFKTLFWLQIIVICGLGFQRLAESVSKERLEKTWDFQRLTPLTSFEITFGKFIGAPLYALFLGACFLPMLIFLWMGVPELRSSALTHYELAIALILFLYALSLLISSYTETNSRGAGIIGLFFIAAFSSSTSFLSKLPDETFYYGISLPTIHFHTIATVLFGFWAFFGAQWRIGKDLMESRKIWRLPSFLLFLIVYILGFGASNFYISSHVTSTALGAVALFSWIAAFANDERIDHWKIWLQHRKGIEKWNYTPMWIQSVTILLIFAVLACILIPEYRERPAAIIFALFILRDMLFLQWCRFTRSIRPSVLAVIYITLGYGIPIAFLAAAGLKDFFFVVTPGTEAKLSDLPLHIFPVILQIAGLIWLNKVWLDRGLRPAAPSQ